VLGHVRVAVKQSSTLRISVLIHDIARLRRTAFDERMKHARITSAQWRILNHVAGHADGGLSQVELAKMLTMGKVALSGIVRRLESRGFVLRQGASTDKRVNRIKVTPKGREMLANVNQTMVDVSSRIIRKIDPAHLRFAESTLRLMRTNLVELRTDWKADLRAEGR
jgi:MarR family transcriptional regulator, transcriptional regulator for hemolysin